MPRAKGEQAIVTASPVVTGLLETTLAVCMIVRRMQAEIDPETERWESLSH